MSKTIKIAPMCECCYARDLVVEADAGLTRSIPYWYCRRCKIEVSLTNTKTYKYDYGDTELDEFGWPPPLVYRP